MHKITITLSDPVKEYVDAQIASGRSVDVSDVFSKLVENENRRAHREAIDRKLLESLDDGEATDLTAGDWNDIRAEVQRRHTERNGGAA